METRKPLASPGEPGVLFAKRPGGFGWELCRRFICRRNLIGSDVVLLLHLNRVCGRLAARPYR